MVDRYDTSGMAEGRYQAGSNESVLENKLGISSADKMEFVEYEALLSLQTQLVDEIAVDQPITIELLLDWHTRWLGDIYAWAGNYRSVNMAKGDFHFAVAHLVYGLMKEFETKVLANYTPCDELNQSDLITALAITHVEFILIHPFRDGNGRLGRLLSIIMALQAGWPILEFSVIENDKQSYFNAIQAGLDLNYEPMKALMASVLESSSQEG